MADHKLRTEETMMRSRHQLRGLGIALVAAIALTLAAVSSASAAYNHITPGYNILNVTPSKTEAGGHPDLEFEFEYRYDDFSACESECLFPRFLRFDMPEGFIGNPHVTSQCSLSDYASQKCPSDSQVGYYYLELQPGFAFWIGVYNLRTRADQAGLLGFTAPVFGLPILLELTGRTNSDYGLRSETSPLLRLPLPLQKLVLWGVPAAHEHDKNRFVTPLKNFGFCAEPVSVGCPEDNSQDSATFAEATSTPAPFLQNPTVCNASLSVTATIFYHGGIETERSGVKSEEVIPWPPMSGCNQASFSPSIVAKPTTTSADTASGLDVDLKVPQTQSPESPAPSEIRTARLTLPEGFSINPNAADGKVACPDLLNGIGTLGPATCPEFSKIGTLMLDVAALPAPIPGALYLAEPKPGEPYRVLLAADGFATHVKLLGTAEPDPQTGRLSVVFDHLPQSPLQEFDLHIFGSERGLLATPSHCGTYIAEGEFVPWNSALATRFTKSSITIDSGPNGTPCPFAARTLAPTLHAGVADNTAGRHSPFSLSLLRSDGEQNLTGLTVKTPPGFAATLKGVSYCPESALKTLESPSHSGVTEQQSPACPASSLIGTATTGAGAGSHPLYVPGKVYLAGPYKGAPLSLVAVIPAVSGPYDLGVVAVRAAIHIDPVTAQVTTVSDPLPQILEGIPLRIRSILINLDRPGFALNPTNCDPLAVEETTLGDEGGQATGSQVFQVANCSDLPYGPKLSMHLSGGLNRLGHPAIEATFTAQPGEANTKAVQVTLPPNEILDNAHIGTVCTRPAFAQNKCPAGSLIGSAEVTTPLLDQPLKGNVYLRANPEHALPDLVMDLEGQFDIELAGRVDSGPNGGLRTTFETAPDAPVSILTLKLAGGKRGLLQNKSSLCGKSTRFTMRATGQNGAIVNSKPKLQASCGSKARHKRHHKKKAGH
jgi:hypothetical protein